MNMFDFQAVMKGESQVKGADSQSLQDGKVKPVGQAVT